MTHDTEVIGLTAALLMGVTGSVHCVGMCSGIAGALGMRIRSVSADASHAALHAALHQMGRVASYMLLGTLCGAIGQLLQTLLDLARIGIVLRIASGILLVLVAARMLFHWNGLVALERVGLRIWKLVQPLTRHVSGDDGLRSFALGLAWGFLPCGMVYSMLAFAALSGSALGGATLMFAFALGTAPAMFGSTLLAATSVKVFLLASTQRAAGFLLAMFGAWMIAAPFLMRTHGAHVH